MTSTVPPAVSAAPPSYATTAYRRDRRKDAGPSGARDGIWLALAVMLEQVALFSVGDRPAKLRHVLKFARSNADAGMMRRLRVREWSRVGLGATDSVVSIADEAHDAGAFHLAAHILDALLVVSPSLTPLQRGRIIARRARIGTKLGEVDASADRYQSLVRLGSRLRIPELRARGLLGQAALAQMRGNYPEVSRLAAKVVDIADRHRLRLISRHAHSGLMVAAAVSGRFDDALAHGWIVYRASRGEPVDEAEVLQNLSQVLFDAGHVREARAGFAALACRRLPARFILAALGGLARAAAALDDGEAVRWASREIERLVQSPAPGYSVALALLEAAQALAAIGEPAAAARRARTAAELARTHGFSEVEYKAESLALSPGAPERSVPEALGPRATAVARDVAQLAPKRLPRRVNPLLVEV